MTFVRRCIDGLKIAHGSRALGSNDDDELVFGFNTARCAQKPRRYGKHDFPGCVEDGKKFIITHRTA